MTGTTVIGKVTESGPNGFTIEYPSVAGLKTVTIPMGDLQRYEILGDGRVALMVSDSAGELVGDGAPFIVTANDIAIAGALEHGEDMSTITIEPQEEVQDDVPAFEAGEVEVSVSDNGEVLVAEVGPFDDMLYSGGRKNKATADWDFIPVEKMGHIVFDDVEANMGRVARINNIDGKPVVKHVFNPNYKSESRPAGAHLGTFSPSYYAMPYAKGFRPILELAAKNGWNAKVFAYEEGKKARLDCDVSSSVNWDDYANTSLGKKWTNHGFLKQGDYRIGFSVHNSLDGSSAYKVNAIAMRLACTNGMVLGKQQTLFSLKHTEGVMANFDFQGLASKIDAVIREAMMELAEVEAMRNIEVNPETFEKLLTLCEKHDLITKPRVHRDDSANITHLTGGHMWRVAMDGWTKPANHWVRVQEEDKNTLYHVYNVMTGAITHKPVYQDNDQYKNKPLEGKKLGFNQMDKRLHAAHKMLRGVAEQVQSAWMVDSGNSVIAPDNLRDTSSELIEGVLAATPMISEVIY